MNYGFVINNETCIGCHACSTACKSENEVPLGVNRTWVKSVETGAFPDVTRHFQVTRCNHCEKPPCVEICPVTAMYQRSDGIVEFDGEACIGCKACLQACPYDAIYIDPDSGTAAKCHYCAHRLDIGLEPACVVVCPEHAIIAGDLDNPQSEISRTLARRKVTVRKPEQGTSPNVFYIGGHDSTLEPTNTERSPETFAWADSVPIEDGGGPVRTGGSRLAEQMVQVVYNAQHRVPWHWQVPAYLVTKAIAAGLFLIIAICFLFGWIEYSNPLFLSGAAGSLVFLAATTALLIFDLERPERFLRILFRPQWKSWLVRGAFILVAFSIVATVWLGLELLTSATDDARLDGLRLPLLLIGIPLAVSTAIYTAFLFGQAEGRDLWQSTLLPIHLLLQSVLAGAAFLLMVDLLVALPDGFVNLSARILTWALILDLGLLLLGELGMRHASSNAVLAAREILKGRYKTHFWIGSVVSGHLLPLICMIVGGPALALGGVLAIAGLYWYEYAFVMAPQVIPNS